MTIATPKKGLQQAQGSDNARDYLKGAIVGGGLVQSLTILDNVILDTLADAKGDLIVGTAADTVARLAVGANNSVLVADSAQAGGMAWQTTLAGLTLTAPVLTNPSMTGAFSSNVSLASTGLYFGGAGTTPLLYKSGSDLRFVSPGLYDFRSAGDGASVASINQAGGLLVSSGGLAIASGQDVQIPGSTSDGIRGSDGTSGKLRFRAVTVNDTATAALAWATGTGIAGIFWIISLEDAMVGVYSIRGAAGATVEISDPSGIFTPTALTASSVNVYWSGSRYEIENRRGGARTFLILSFAV